MYIIRPIAILLTNTWSGSLIDRVNKRRLMIGVNLLRGCLVALIPLIQSLALIYFLLLLISMIGAFFGPSSNVYITKLVPQENRKRFNSIMSMTNSGAFLLGPALAGVLIMAFGTDICIWINSIAFLICAFCLYLLPNVDEKREVREPKRWKTIVDDWKTVKAFVVRARFFMMIYLLFQTAMLFGFALDSQEVTFIKQNLHLSDQAYGLIVSITGLGAIVGAAVATMLAKRINLKWYLGGGLFLTMIGYFLFYSSVNFLTATVAFVFLGFFMAFANAGYATFFQNQVPVHLMGRFGSLADMIQAVIQIVLTLLLGFFAEWFSLQMVCLLFSIVGMVVALNLLVKITRTSKASFFEESGEGISK
ncbi:MFS transporter [Alkalihalobacillus alcalophilus]